jgi:hypothetical protein
MVLGAISDSVQEGADLVATSGEQVADEAGVDYEWTGVEPTDAGALLSGPAGWAYLATEQQVPDDPITGTFDDVVADGSPIYSDPGEEGGENTLASRAFKAATGFSISEINTVFKALLAVVVVGGALWLLRPVLDLGAEVAG